MKFEGHGVMGKHNKNKRARVDKSFFSHRPLPHDKQTHIPLIWAYVDSKDHITSTAQSQKSKNKFDSILKVTRPKKTFDLQQNQITTRGGLFLFKQFYRIGLNYFVRLD
nr:hypothetical protein [uncultured Pseudodesulfovibrio sp.]